MSFDAEIPFRNHCRNSYTLTFNKFYGFIVNFMGRPLTEILFCFSTLLFEVYLHRSRLFTAKYKLKSKNVYCQAKCSIGSRKLPFCSSSTNSDKLLKRGKTSFLASCAAICRKVFLLNATTPETLFDKCAICQCLSFLFRWNFWYHAIQNNLSFEFRFQMGNKYLFIVPILTRPSYPVYCVLDDILCHKPLSEIFGENTRRLHQVYTGVKQSFDL